MATLEERLDYGMFRIQRREDGSLWTLGRGAMGVTYRAVNTSLDTPVALKVIDLGNGVRPEDAKRFVCEARAMAALQHKHIASVYHLDREDGQVFYAMELINGETTQEYVRRCGPMPVDAALKVASQVCLALAAAARRQLVHRDIKPANIMIVLDVDEDEWPFVKLIDFGLVRSLTENSEASYATLPGFVGTAQFASPEQIREEPVDARADIYSLGCTLWYLLTGEAPFEGPVAKVFGEHLHAEPPWEKLHGLPRPVVKLLRQTMQKDPARRPDAAQLRRDLENCRARLSRPQPRVAGRELTRDMPTWPLRLALAVLCLAVLVVLAFAPGAAPQGGASTKEEALVTAQKNTAQPRPAPPRWEYLAAAFPDSDYLASRRPLRLSHTPIPTLGPPGGDGWLGERWDGGQADLWSAAWDWHDPVLLASLQDIEPAQPKPRKPMVRRTTAQREEGFSPRREIDRARRSVERTLRRFF
jgi:hypothetical protein